LDVLDVSAVWKESWRSAVFIQTKSSQRKNKLSIDKQKNYNSRKRTSADIGARVSLYLLMLYYRLSYIDSSRSNESIFPEIAAKESAIADDGDVFMNK
jgi:hypothetical protein